MDETTDPFEYFFDRPWSDGLPVVTPTAERIEWMLSGTSREPDESLGGVPPAHNEATVEGVAQHAVMAGCRPDYLPALLGAVEAMLIEEFNINGLQGTMGPGGPMIIFNGPYAMKIGLHGGSGCFGPGFRANATIGRAIRLILMNLGGGLPGISDMSCFGSPVKYTFCIRENEEMSPWHPLAVDRGFSGGDDVVTLYPAEQPRQAFDDSSAEPDGLLTTIASAMSSMGMSNSYMRQNMVVAISPDHSAVFKRAGLSRDEVKQILFEKARLPLKLMKLGGRYHGGGKVDWPDWVDLNDDESMVPMIHVPEDIILLVAGGRPGPHSTVVPAWNKSSQTVSLRYRTD
ncbi:MAG: hypothetical protein HOC91_12355 [Nitrospinaceae bacterium]|jgi:hypothetical protein|nr:hypothetical protein [Nitrospinaceae bacterium]MBT3433258.1 hypothetical protein [Nitrospinaceae bacterium]MBT3822159.1 hypothetical protein [Nitrospinaceae bacterium]MBT4095123.1 hypothetical protein [Nitrospinaceae bacterium]MBT4431301.1 hypothetical protein [Nitrospinaceae bacterium]